jgi:hypothetical protein
MTFEYKHCRISIYQDASGFAEASITGQGIKLTIVSEYTESEDALVLASMARAAVDTHFRERLLYAVKCANVG